MATIHGANEPYPLSHTLHSSVWHPIRKGPFNSNSSTYSCAKKTFPKQVTPNLCFCAGESKRPDEMKILHRSKLAHILSEGRKFCPLLGIREVPRNSRTKTLGHSRQIGTECPLFGYETSVSLGSRKTKLPFLVFLKRQAMIGDNWE